MPQSTLVYDARRRMCVRETSTVGAAAKANRQPLPGGVCACAKKKKYSEFGQHSLRLPRAKYASSSEGNCACVFFGNAFLNSTFEGSERLRAMAKHALQADLVCCGREAKRSAAGNRKRGGSPVSEQFRAQCHWMARHRANALRCVPSCLRFCGPRLADFRTTQSSSSSSRSGMCGPEWP